MTKYRIAQVVCSGKETIYVEYRSWWRGWMRVIEALDYGGYRGKVFASPTIASDWIRLQQGNQVCTTTYLYP